MKGQKFIPKNMEKLRQEFRNRPVVVETVAPVAVMEAPMPEPIIPKKKWADMNRKERQAYQKERREQTISG